MTASVPLGAKFSWFKPLNILCKETEIDHQIMNLSWFYFLKCTSIEHDAFW